MAAPKRKNVRNFKKYELINKIKQSLLKCKKLKNIKFK